MNNNDVISRYNKKFLPTEFFIFWQDIKRMITNAFKPAKNSVGANDKYKNKDKTEKHQISDYT